MYSTEISAVYGREILDSRGNPTVMATVVLKNGIFGYAAAPSGASTGSYEAVELRDGDKKRYGGKGVLKAVSNINGKISGLLAGQNVCNQHAIDKKMIEADGTENKSSLGANAILAVSAACMQAAAAASGMPLYRYVGGISACRMPVPMMNILNGGAHANNNVDIQEFMIVPTGSVYFSEGLRKCSEVYHSLAKILKKSGMSAAVGDEGGFAPDLGNDADAIDLIMEAISDAGYTAPGDFMLALDVAASEWVDKNREGKYITPKHGVKHDSDSLIGYMNGLCTHYPIMSIEDPLAEDDWEGWKKITEKLGDKIMLVGDDLFVTNKLRLDKGISENCANSILIKPNQIGTVSETAATVNLAKQNSSNVILSHRSGETEDTMIADLAVGLGPGYIKSGAPARAERTAKYNRLLQIEQEMRSLL